MQTQREPLCFLPIYNGPDAPNIHISSDARRKVLWKYDDPQMKPNVPMRCGTMMGYYAHEKVTLVFVHVWSTPGLLKNKVNVCTCEEKNLSQWCIDVVLLMTTINRRFWRHGSSVPDSAADALELTDAIGGLWSVYIDTGSWFDLNSTEECWEKELIAIAIVEWQCSISLL